MSQTKTHGHASRNLWEVEKHDSLFRQVNYYWKPMGKVRPDGQELVSMKYPTQSYLHQTAP